MIDLRFDDVYKRYRIRQEESRGRLGDFRLKNFKLKNFIRAKKDFWALSGVSFDVSRGEGIGIIGPNGAGKSTIMKLLSRITAPTSGEIEINGRLSALIEVGSGFHPELTGRENVYLSGSLLGMKRREIARKLESIIEFADVGQFIDVPVKWYSSGMYVRLGFSISAHLDADILLLDEVLAVGDAAFQARCFERIAQLEREGKTIVFISHDLDAVERLCDRVLLMEKGRLLSQGKPREVIARYKEVLEDAGRPLSPEPLGESKGAVSITGLCLCDDKGSETDLFRTGDRMIARVGYRATAPLPDAVFEVFYYSRDGRFLYCQQTTAQTDEPIDLSEGCGTVEFICSELGLQPGIYSIGVSIKERAAPYYIDWWYASSRLQVETGRWVRGSFYMPHDWRLRASNVESGEESVRGALFGIKG